MRFLYRDGFFMFCFVEDKVFTVPNRTETPNTNPNRKPKCEPLLICVKYRTGFSFNPNERFSPPPSILHSLKQKRLLQISCRGGKIKRGHTNCNFSPLMVLMIIKGIFRRYERWNPVHPTYGAFWGMGIGIGCGVGWGPGFGPEVVGYVGAGCGVGFSVGITLAGVGIGLPANSLLSLPYNTVVATRKGAIEMFAGSSNIPFLKNLSTGGWNDVRPQIADLQRQLHEIYSGFNHNPLMNSGIDITNMPMFISRECGRFGNHLLRSCKGSDDRHRGNPSAT